jgi:hypothetical protein
MFRSFLINEDTTRVLPWRKLGIATLIVAIKIKRISCTVERKIAGRSLRLEGSSSRVTVKSSDATAAAGRSTEAIIDVGL